MLESVFFITLGISCVLLIMLIYHFKQRLNKLEQNGNTMFEIINNLAQEITTVNNNFRARSIERASIENLSQTSMQPNITHSKINVSLSDDEDNNLTLEETYIDNEGNTNESCSDDESGSDNDADEESGSDNDDEESGSDNDDEESGSDNDDEESGSDNDDEESGSGNDDEESGSDNGDEESDSDNDNILEEEADVKVVNINLNDNLDSIETPNNEIETDDGNLEQVELNTDEIENILVSKLDETNDLEENDNSTPTPVNTGAVYKKMNVYSLKALVIEKGLSSDPSGLKKKELINLLKSNE